MLPFIGGLGDSAGATISKSLRFRLDVPTYLTRTFSGALTDGKRGTISFWIKRHKLGATSIVSIGTDGAAVFRSTIGFNADDTMVAQLGGAGSNDIQTAPMVFRDTSAWFHIVYTWDTVAQTQTLYANGIVVATGTTPLNLVSQFGTNAGGQVNVIGIFSDFVQFGAGAYLADYYMIDGQSLSAASFGYIDPTTGVWRPRNYGGTYGNNGFHIDFSDSSAATGAALGKDQSGNGLNWTPISISVTGAATDSFVDVPTPKGSSSNLLGGAVRGNYPMWQATNHRTTAAITNGGLTAGGAGNAVASVGIDVATLGPTEKIYWEVTFGGANGSGGVRVDSGATFTAAFTTGQIAGFRLNANGDVDYTLNGSTWTTIVTGSAFGIYTPYTTTANAGALFTLNAGQRPFNFPMIDATYHELVSTLIPDYFGLDVRNGKKFFDAGIWTGNSTLFPFTRIIKAFSPGIVWGKSRNAVQDHYLVDSTRGSSIYSIPNKSDVQSLDPGTISAINSDGFTLGNSNNLNTTGNTYVGWMFNKAAPFLDIQLFGKSAATNETFGHLLGQKPGLMIVKPVSGTGVWVVWHKDLANANQDWVLLNTNAIATTGDPTIWNNTQPTSTTFSMGTGWAAYAQVVAYLFGEVPGLCKIGSYTGNGAATGFFVHCGFKPAFVLIKRIDVANDWVIFDSIRNPNNPGASLSFSDLTSAETVTTDMDLLSNGFRILTAGAGRNAAAGTYLYMAIAEHPFKYARAR